MQIVFFLKIYQMVVNTYMNSRLDLKCLNYIIDASALFLFFKKISAIQILKFCECVSVFKDKVVFYDFVLLHS